MGESWKMARALMMSLQVSWATGTVARFFGLDEETVLLPFLFVFFCFPRRFYGTTCGWRGMVLQGKGHGWAGRLDWCLMGVGWKHRGGWGMRCWETWFGTRKHHHHHYRHLFPFVWFFTVCFLLPHGHMQFLTCLFCLLFSFFLRPPPVSTILEACRLAACPGTVLRMGIGNDANNNL